MEVHIDSGSCGVGGQLECCFSVAFEMRLGSFISFWTDSSTATPKSTISNPEDEVLDKHTHVIAGSESKPGELLGTLTGPPKTEADPARRRVLRETIESILMKVLKKY